MSAEPTYVDILGDFKQELAKLSTWDMRSLANINKENFISVTEACDPKTDAMVGWEQCTTLEGLVAKKAVPDVTKLSDDEIINLFDNLLSREFATLDGQRIMLGPFACVYLYDVEGLTKGNDAVYQYLKSFLASTNLIYSLCGEAQVLENEELMFQCQEVLALSQGVDIINVIAGLKEAAEKATNADIKLRLELRRDMLQTMLNLYVAHSIENKDVDKAVADATQIAADLRSKLIASRAKLGAITSDAKLFPTDVRYWLTTNTTTSSTEPDLTEQLEKVAKFFDSIGGFTAFANCKNFFEIAAVAEKVALAAPCVLTRPFAYNFIFRDRPIADQPPSRIARGDRLLGDKSLRMSILKYLETDMGAPLYFQLLDSSVNPIANPNLNNVANYILACSKGLSGVKANTQELHSVMNQVLQSTYRWLDMTGHIVADMIQSALFNMGRHQRRIANRLTDLNQLHNFSWECDQRVFCARYPTPNVAQNDGGVAREQSARVCVLSAFAADLICDSMEKFVRLTMRLDLPTKPEYAACTWYLDLIAATRLEQVQAIAVKSTDKAALIPALQVNKRTGNPLACPALCSRTVVDLNEGYTRADIARQVSEVAFMVFGLFTSHKLIAGYDVATSTSLASAESMFDHRMAFLGRCRFPGLPPFAVAASRSEQLKSLPLYRLVLSSMMMAADAFEKAKSAAAHAGPNAVFYDELAQLMESARGILVALRTLRTALFSAVADGTNPNAVPNPTAEEVEKAFAEYTVAFEAPFDKSVIIPVITKKE